MKWRRNSDEAMRRRERAMAAEPTQQAIDRVILDKIRSGRSGEITLFELHRGSLNLIPSSTLQHALQDAFDKLWKARANGDTSPRRFAQVECEGADVSLFVSGEEEPWDMLAVSVDSVDMNKNYVWQGDCEIPRVRFYVNEGSVETRPDGGWEAVN